MSELLFHTATRAVRGPARRSGRAITVRALIARAAARLRRARVYLGHGTDNAWDEAAALVWHGVRLPPGGGALALRRRVGPAAQARVRALVTRRIRERIPAAYLTGVAWFAGVPLHVDARVLVPRSPIAEPIARGFGPWIDARRVRRVLDLGTGSGCIAIACARALPRARIDAVDISDAALEVARRNVRRHRLARPGRARQSEHFPAPRRPTPHIILSQPPYLCAREPAGP